MMVSQSLFPLQNLVTDSPILLKYHHQLLHHHTHLLQNLLSLFLFHFLVFYIVKHIFFVRSR